MIETDIANEINTIKERNRRVEADKAWERSMLRIGSITVITYIIAAFVMYTIGVNGYLLNALIPSIGYFLSTQSLPAIKQWWIRRCYKKEK